MENLIDKTTKSSELRSAKPKKTTKMISEEDIRLRAYELFQEDGGTSHNELDDWFRAESELNESDR